MISYMSVDRVEGDIAVCELEMIWIEDSRTEDYWKKETIMVDVPMEKFENCGPRVEAAEQEGLELTKTDIRNFYKNVLDFRKNVLEFEKTFRNLKKCP